MAWTSGIVGSTFRRYITTASAFIGPYIDSQGQYDYTKMLYSVDGLTWSYGSTNRPVVMQGKTPSGLYYGYDQDKFLTSTDRNTWSIKGSFPSGLYPQQILYGINNNIYVALCTDLASGGNDLVYSTDGGISWSGNTSPNNLMSITLAYANYNGTDRFVGVDYFGGQYEHSSNGITWTTVATSAIQEGMKLRSANNKIFAFKHGPSSSSFSNILLELPPSGLVSYTIPYGRYADIEYGNGKYIMIDFYSPASYDGVRASVGTSLSSLSSSILGAGLPNGPAYGMSWNSVLYGPGQGFRIFSNYGDTILYSSDGNTWARQPVEYGTDTTGLVFYWPGTYQV